MDWMILTWIFVVLTGICFGGTAVRSLEPAEDKWFWGFLVGLFISGAGAIISIILHFSITP